MAKAHIEWGCAQFDCEFGQTPLDDRNYSCPNSGDGLHDWEYARSECLGCGLQECYCIECGSLGCDCQ